MNDPLITEAPVITSVPLLWLNVLACTKFPPTERVSLTGALNVPPFVNEPPMVMAFAPDVNVLPLFGRLNVPDTVIG
jgi:hypothetical protein